MRTLCTAVSMGHFTKRCRRRRKWMKDRGGRKRKRKNRRYHHGLKIMEISTREYRHLAMGNKGHFWIENLKKREPWYAAVIGAMPSFKIAGFDLYLERLKFFWMHLRFLLAFSAEHSFHKFRFLNDRMKRKAVDALAKRIVPVPSKKVCIAYGDWSQRDGIKGHPTGPVKGFQAALKRRGATVLPMDEYRTSKLCSSCHHCLKQTRLFTKVRKKKKGDKEEPKKKKDANTKLSKKELKELKETSKIKNPRLLRDFNFVLKSNRNVLRCENSRCKATFWGRDVNAARNMLNLLRRKLLKEGPWMEEFKRGQQT